MHNRTRIRVAETDDELHQLERRITMLRLMKQQPDITQRELAAQLGVSERQIRRWEKRYHDGGRDALLGVALPSSPAAPVVLPSSVRLQKFLDFTNTLPHNGTVYELSHAMAGHLIALFDDVDHAAVVPNAWADLKTPGVHQSDSTVTHFYVREREHLKMRGSSGAENITSVTEGLRESGLLGQEQTPSRFIYHYEGEFLGIIMLWRDPGLPAISPQTLAFMRMIEPFLIFVLSDFVMRNTQGPLEAGFNDALTQVTAQAKLTIRERETLLHVLRGQGYVGAAEAIGISVDGIKKRMREVYIKTQTKNLEELFGTYFTPHLIPRELPELPEQE